MNEITLKLKHYLMTDMSFLRKTVEVRKLYDATLSITPGTKITFVSNSGTCVQYVGDVRQYTTLHHCLMAERIDQICPGKSYDEATKFFLLDAKFRPNERVIAMDLRVHMDPPRQLLAINIGNAPSLRSTQKRTENQAVKSELQATENNPAVGPIKHETLARPTINDTSVVVIDDDTSVSASKSVEQLHHTFSIKKFEVC